MMKKLLYVLWVSMIISLGCKSHNHEHANHLITVQEFEKVYDEDVDILLDVRTAAEYSDSHIGGALNMNVLEEDTFINQIQSLPKDKDIYLYCRSGNRSVKSTKILKDQGFENVQDIEGGYMQWQQYHSQQSTSQK